MCARCRAFDWASTPLGPVAQWSQSLRTVVGLMLASRHPMFLWWGPELIQLFNDGYLPSLGTGDRSSAALGARGREHWAEIWPVIGPDVDAALVRGEASWHEDQLIPIERNGRVEKVWWTYGYSPVRDDDGAIAGVLVVVQETTSRVRALETREALLAELNRSFDAAPFPIAVTHGPTHQFVLANAAMERSMGRSLIGRTVLEAFPEAEAFATLMDRVYRRGTPFSATEAPAVLLNAHGAPEERWFNFIYQPVRDPDGIVTGIITQSVDVSEQVRSRQRAERDRDDAEQARRLTANLLALSAALSHASTFPGVVDAVVSHPEALFDATGIIVARVNEAARELEIVDVRDLPPDLLDDWRRIPLDAAVPLADVARTHVPVFLESREDWLSRYPDLTAALDATGHAANVILPLLVDDRLLGVLGAAFDAPRVFTEADRSLALTIASQCAQAFERARLHDAERDARRDAEVANRSKSEFLAVMSHELRTPLNAIGGYADLMELEIHGPVTAEQRTALGRIQKSQRHLLGLINGVLNYARVDGGHVHYEIADVVVDDVLATSEALVAPQARARRVALRYDACDAALVARVDPEKLQQVVLNLLTNAVKFTEPGGATVLRCVGVVGGMITVQVTDTGRGVKREQMERIFQPFVQVDARLTRTQEGVGLGLAISRDLARGMGGDLTVESVYGEGSTFSLTIPVREQG